MGNKKTSLHPTDHNQTQGSNTPEINWWEFLKRAGKFAAYTPATLMLLVQPSYAKIAKSNGHQENENFQLNKVTGSLYANANGR